MNDLDLMCNIIITALEYRYMDITAILSRAKRSFPAHATRIDSLTDSELNLVLGSLLLDNRIEESPTDGNLYKIPERKSAKEFGWRPLPFPSQFVRSDVKLLPRYTVRPTPVCPLSRHN